jgi:hypothetical protein
MARHSAVVHRGDGPENPQPIDFQGNGWPAFVPIRVTGTLVVEERLPPGAAAVLINPSHTYTDIYLPIDAEEKRMFVAIDGRKTIEEILGSTSAGSRGAPNLGFGRSFFERLWWYDQVVFDASRCEGSPPDARNREL